MNTQRDDADVDALIMEATKRRSKSLTLRSFKLKEIPPKVFELFDLHELSVGSNLLRFIPSEALSKLTNLTKLFLGYNSLTCLPDSIKYLTQLQVLSLSFNNITSIPDSIDSLTNLEVLHLSNNQLVSISNNIGQLSSLTELFIHNNLLAVLPDSICKLIKLQKLYVSDNLLTALPDKIGLLTGLESLATNKNKLKVLPISIGNLSHLKSILANNQLLENGTFISIDPNIFQARRLWRSSWWSCHRHVYFSSDLHSIIYLVLLCYGTRFDKINIPIVWGNIFSYYSYEEDDVNYAR